MAEMVTAAQGWDIYVAENTNILSYQDFDQIGDWAIPGLQLAAGSGVLRDTGSGAPCPPRPPPPAPSWPLSWRATAGPRRSKEQTKKNNQP